MQTWNLDQHGYQTIVFFEKKCASSQFPCCCPSLPDLRARLKAWGRKVPVVCLAPGAVWSISHLIKAIAGGTQHLTEYIVPVSASPSWVIADSSLTSQQPAGSHRKHITFLNFYPAGRLAINLTTFLCGFIRPTRVSIFYLGKYMLCLLVCY